MPVGYQHHGAVAIGGRLHLVGGQQFVNGAFTSENVVMAYDPVSDTWTARAPVAVAGGPYAGLVNQALSFSGTAVGTLAALPSARNLPGATGIASALFVMGGTDSTNTQIVTSLFGVNPPARRR